MSDTKTSEETMLSALHDIRLPADAAGGLMAEIFAAIAVGACLALVAGGVLRFLTTRRPSRNEGLREQYAAAIQLPDPERKVALLHLLTTHAPDKFAQFRDTLYRAEGAVDLTALEAEAGRLV